MATARSHAVLVAHADRGLGEALRHHLELSGWRVLSAQDGRAALSALREEAVRLAILQVDLPRMDGIKVVREAQAGGRCFHIVFLDSTKEPSFRPQCLALGALAYMGGPLSMQALDNVLKDAVRRPPARARGRESGLAPTSELSPGERIRLVVTGGPSTGSYAGVVVDSGPASLVISAWTSDGTPVYLSLGTVATVGFPAARGWGEFQSRVIGSYISTPVIEIMLSRTGRVLYRQRRRSERLRAALPIRAWPVTSRDAASALVAGHTEDIGSRGLRACFEKPIPAGKTVMLVISPSGRLPEARLRGRRVWHETIGDRYQEWHRYGFRFSELLPEARHNLSLLLAHIRSLGEDLEDRSPEDLPLEADLGKS